MPFPVSLEVDPAAFLEDVQKLIQTTAAFGDVELGGMNRCLLAAAGELGPSSSATVEQLVAMAQAEPAEVSTAVKDLIHCQEISLSDESSFFSLFRLVGKMKLKSCEELCREAVSSLAYKNTPIRLQLSSAHGEALRQHLRNPATVPDATIFIQSSNASERLRPRRVHAVVLAASCEYIRGLWAGGFSEAAGPAEVRIEDPADAEAAEALIKLVYGETAEVASIDELLQLFRLADRWQCSSVREQALKQIASEISSELEDENLGLSHKILEQSPRLPDNLLRLAAKAVAEVYSESLFSIPTASFSLAAAVRLHEALCEVDFLDKDDREELIAIHLKDLTVLDGDDNQFLEGPEWVQTQADLMGSLLYAMSSGEKLNRDFSSHLVCWAFQGGEDAGKAVLRLISLRRPGAPECMETTLAEARSRCIVSAQVAVEMLNAAHLNTEDALVAPTEEAASSETEGPTKKRRRTMQADWASVLPALEPVAKDLLREAGFKWAAEHFEDLAKSDSWLALKADALVRTAEALLREQADQKRRKEEEQKEMEEGEPSDVETIVPPESEDEIVERKAEVEDRLKVYSTRCNSMCVRDLKARLKILGLPSSGNKAELVDRLLSAKRKEAHHGESPKQIHKSEVEKEEEKDEKKEKAPPCVATAVAVWAAAAEPSEVADAIALGKGCPVVLSAVADVLRSRLAKAERRAAMFEDGKALEELESAVAAAKAETEARIRLEWTNAEAKLQRELQDQKRRELNTLQQGIMALFQPQPDASVRDVSA